MNDQTMRFRLGVFVLFSLILLAVLITLFGGSPFIFTPFDRYTLVFDNASGVGVGTPVKRSGVKIGEVEKVELDNTTGKVSLTLKIDRQYTLRLGDDAIIVRSLVGGDATIEFVARRAPVGKEPDSTPIEPGTVVIGVSPPPGDAMQQAGELLPLARDTLTEVQKAFAAMNKMVPVLEGTFKDLNEVAKMAKSMVPNVKNAGEEISKLAQSARETMPSIRSTSEEVRMLARATRGAIPSVLSTSDELRELARTTREAVPSVKATSDELRELARTTREAVPGVKATSDEIRELARATRATLPELRRTAEDVQLLVKNWSKVGERTDRMLKNNEEKVTQTLDELRTTVKQVNKTFNDDNQRMFSEILGNFRDSSKKLDSLTNNTDALMKDARVTLKSLGDTMGKADNVLVNMEKITKPLVDRGGKGGILNNLDEASHNMNKVLLELREMLRAVSRGDGTIQRLLSDPALYQRLEEAAAGITRLMPRMDRMLEDVEIFADKIARHPESLGIAGVVRPGSGMKDAPGPLYRRPFRETYVVPVYTTPPLLHVAPPKSCEPPPLVAPVSAPVIWHQAHSPRPTPPAPPPVIWRKAPAEEF